MRSIDTVLKPADGYHYEPRALWGRMLRERATTEAEVTLDRFVPFGKQDFYNSGRWPMLITHMVVMSKPLEAATPRGNGDDFALRPIVRPTIRIAKQGTRPFSILQNIGAIDWLGDTCSGPKATNPGSTGTFADFSDGFNTVRWDLELPMRVPNRGMVQFDISGTPPLLFAEAADPDDIITPVGLRGTAQFYEVADAAQSTPGNTRPNVRDMLTMSERDARAFTSDAAVTAVINLSNDALTLANPYGGVPSTWDNGYGMPGKTFLKAQAAGNRASMLDAMQFSFLKTIADGSMAFMPTDAQALTPDIFTARQNITTSLYCRAKVQQGGSNTWFWREGAPLALVMPTLTPNPVYRFPAPIELQPGEGFDVFGSIPTDGLYSPIEYSVGGDDLTYASHAFYVSFCGYAALKV